MRPGQLVGGKVATPIREMLADISYNCVNFHCEDPEHAETIRLDALMLAKRNNYDLCTHRNGKDLIVYKEGYAEYDPSPIHVDVRRGRGSKF